MPYKDLRQQRAYQRKWMAQRRQEFLVGKQCAWCGSTDRLVVHHKDRSQKEEHRIWSWSKKRREKELAKCVVICTRCHEEHHKEEKRRISSNVVHGTSNTYKNGCRCELCREAQRVHNGLYYRGKRGGNVKVKGAWHDPSGVKVK